MKILHLTQIMALSSLLVCGACHNHAAEGHDHDLEANAHASEKHAPDEHDDHEAGEKDKHSDEIHLSPESAKRFGVKCEILRGAPFHETLTVSGRIESSVSDMATASAPRAGIVTTNTNLVPGMKVSAGQTIATVSPKGLAGGDAQRAAVANRDAARAELNRLTPLYNDGIVSAKEYNEARRTLAEAEALVGTAPGGASSVTAPRGGVVTRVLVTPGEYVELGQPVAVISSNLRLTLRADVPARHRDFLPSVVSANFRPDCADKAISLSSLNGRLNGSPLAASGEKGYIPVYFSFDNDGSVVPGSFAEVTLLGAQRAEVLSVPAEAIVEMQGNKYVYTRVHDDAYVKNLVKTGRSDGQRVEILSGLKAGDNLVVNGAGVVRLAETSNVAPPGHSHNH